MHSNMKQMAIEKGDAWPNLHVLQNFSMKFSMTGLE